jgi:iron complex outermembrane receptor protein
MTIRLKSVLFAGVAAFAAGTGFAAQAQDATRGGAQIEEVIVTAQKREERLQDVPIAVSAYSAQAIEQFGFENALEVAAQTPNFRVGGLAGTTASITPWLNIRGIQFTDVSFVNDASVALYVDEVYQGSTGAGVQQMFDVERVEVLKGPQGSLFGRNSSSGLVQYVTKKPTSTFEAAAAATYGQYDKYGLEGAVSGPITDRLRGRIAGKWLANDGYRKNPITGADSFGKTDTKAVRGTLQFDAAEDFLLTVSGHYAEGDNKFTGRDYRGTRVPGNTAVRCANPQDVWEGRCSTRRDFINSSDDPRTTYSIREVPASYIARGANLRADLKLGDIEIVSISGIENWKSYLVQDTGFGPYSVNNITSDFLLYTKNWSQELRASGSNGPVNWVIGGFYYEDKRRNYSNIYDWWAMISPTPIAPSSVSQGRWSGVDTTSAALYAHMEAEIVDGWTLALGGRYSNEHRDMVLQRFWANCGYLLCAPSLNGTGKGKFSNFSGDITLRWKPTDNLMTYAKFARGFKSGGWNPSAANPTLAGPADPEIVDSWETGLKADWFDRRLRTNVALFYNKFDGFQSTLVQIVNGASVSNFVNAGKAKIYGSEWEITAIPIENLELRGGVGTLYAKMTEVQQGGLGILPGNHLPNAPAFNANGSARYTFELGGAGKLSLQGEFTNTSRLFFTIDNDPYRTMKGYTLYNARIMWDSEDGKYNAQFSIENIANKRYATGAFQTASFDVMYYEYGLPRWWTFKVGAKF